MEPYVRPAIPSREFRDPEGNVIAYGERWGMEGPPDDTYSVLTHPERFQPVHDVARALIAYLARAYDVTVSEDRALLTDVSERYVRATAVTRLTPTNPRSAPVTVVFTDLPGIVLMAGALLEEPLPGCGCDACDDSAEAVANDLEWMVFAVVEGGLSERVTRGPRTWVSHRLERSDGYRCGEGLAVADSTRKGLADARARLAPLEGGRWEPWGPREETSGA